MLWGKQLSCDQAPYEGMLMWSVDDCIGVVTRFAADILLEGGKFFSHIVQQAQYASPIGHTKLRGKPGTPLGNTTLMLIVLLDNPLVANLF